jgi:hypothetical protein
VQMAKQLFVGIKVSRALQNELDSPAPGTKHYLEPGTPDYLEIVTMGDDKIIGRYVENGSRADEVGTLGRNVCSIVRIVARGYRIEEESVLVYTR